MRLEPDCGLAIGLGFQRGVTRAGLESAIIETLGPAATARVRRLATLAAKCGEPGLAELARARGWVLIGYSAERLAAVAGVAASARVGAATGTPSVAEAAARLASGGQPLIIPRQVYRDAKGKALTLAVASMR